MKTHKIGFTGNMEVFKSKKSKAHTKLQAYFKAGGEADELVKAMDKDMNVTVYMPKNGDIFVRFEHLLSQGKDLGEYKFSNERRAIEVMNHFKIITNTTNNVFKKYISLPNAGDFIRKCVFENLK